MEIKTLAQIIAETPQKSKRSSHKKEHTKTNHSSSNKPRVQPHSTRGFGVSQDNSIDSQSLNSQSLNSQSPKKLQTDSRSEEDKELNPPSNKTQFSKRKKKKTFHPASPYVPKVKWQEPLKEVDPNSIKNLLAQVRQEASENEWQNSKNSESYNPNNETYLNADADGGSSSIDNLPTALKAYLKTPQQRQAEKEEIKANSRLRWLAFYYLSRREHSAGELRQKLIDKEQDPDKVEALLTEFVEKGYQSDYRTAIMLIREGIRKGRGRVRIKNDFYQRKVDMPGNIDELIDMATDDNEEFIDVLSNNDLVDGVDWLRLAVEARVKKYGDTIPTEQKEKARQLRFLQYRGFQPNICFEAINYNLHTLDERF